MNDTAESWMEPKEITKPSSWLFSHAINRNRILLTGVNDGYYAHCLSIPTTGYVVGVCDFCFGANKDHGVDRLITTVAKCAQSILLRKLRLKIGKLHTLPDSELADQFDMFVLNQPYGSADEASRDIQRGISLCQPEALICGTCYNNPATKEAVDKLLPFRQLFGNIWFGYL